uniref:Uncharacterized protein n=1 Tax=Poecilia latipinna TaxID=48699 RepID=A0A3B3VTT7_9TELE
METPTFLKDEAVLLLATAYDSNIENLKQELHQVRVVMEKKKREKECPTTLMEMTQCLDRYQDVFCELFRLYNGVEKLHLVIKTYLRSAMTETRLSSLTVLSIESKRTKSLDLDKFVKRLTMLDKDPTKNTDTGGFKYTGRVIR